MKVRRTISLVAALGVLLALSVASASANSPRSHKGRPSAALVAAVMSSQNASRGGNAAPNQGGPATAGSLYWIPSPLVARK
jgi:hypothetical protein